MENTPMLEEKFSFMSPTIGKLADALSKAQGIIEGSKLSGDNPFFHSKYSTLASIWDTCRKPLSSNGLAVIQTTSFSHPELVVIETTLAHASGEWIRGILSMKPTKTDPQSIGSCITYARRYALAAIVGIAPEDDDGNAATGLNKETGGKPPEGSKELPKEEYPSTNAPTKKELLISEPQRKRFYAIAKGSGKTDEEIKEHLKFIIGSEHTGDILREVYEDLCSWAAEK